MKKLNEVYKKKVKKLKSDLKSKTEKGKVTPQSILQIINEVQTLTKTLSFDLDFTPQSQKLTEIKQQLMKSQQTEKLPKEDAVQ